MTTNRTSSSGLRPFTTALWAGLTWGVLFGFVDNLPLLTQGDIISHVRIRLQAMAYTTVLYAVAFAVLLATTGLLLTVLLALVRRPASRAALLGLYTGLLAAGISIGTWLQYYGLLDIPAGNRNRPVALALCSAAGLLVGVFSGWLTYRAGCWWEESPPRRRFPRWTLRWGAPTLVLLCAFLLLSVGLYRNVLRQALALPAGSPATAERPNIVLITIDTLRADHLGIYGYDPAISPNIDALARRGVFFRQAIAQSSWTLPSVTSLVTGMYPTELDIYSRRGFGEQVYLDPQRTTLAEALKSGGYRTQAYLTNAWLTVENALDQGFDNFVGFRVPEPFDLDQLLQRPAFRLAWGSPLLRQIITASHRLLFDYRLTPGEDGHHVSDYGVNFMQEHRGERFFLWLYYMEPHPPYNSSQPFPSLPEGISEAELNRLQGLDFWTLVDAGRSSVPPEEMPALMSVYDGEIHDVDAWIGEIVAELDRLGLSDRTLVVLHSDHGEEFLDHQGYGHGTTFYDELTHVPLVVAGPGVVGSGRAIETPVALLDVLPTLVEAGGVAPPPESDGQSLWPLLRGEEMAEVPIYSEMLHTTPEDRKAVRYQGWKLIYDLTTDQVELYDLRADPKEQVHLAEGETARVEEYLRLLRRWLAQAVKKEETLPRSQVPAGVDERVRAMLREGGY
jgi:arylsulfatase A-like enzyme